MTDLTMFRGDGAKFDIVVALDGLVVDITGAKLWMTARRSPGSPFTFTRTTLTTPGFTITAGALGKATVILDPADTSALASEPVTLIYDIQIKEASGRVWTVTSGNLTVNPDVTTDIA